MKSFSDKEVLDNMNHHYEAAKTLQKEGGNASRMAGDCGRASSNWIMWRREARERGLV